MENKRFTTIQINKEINENLREIKHKFHYKSNNELLGDMTRYFINYNVSPREASMPIFDQFKTIDKTFRSFFKEYENKLFKPFVNAQSQINIKLLDYLENSENNVSKREIILEEKISNNPTNEGIYLSKEKLDIINEIIRNVNEGLFTKKFKVFSKENGENRRLDAFQEANFYPLKDAIEKLKIEELNNQCI